MSKDSLMARLAQLNASKSSSPAGTSNPDPVSTTESSEKGSSISPTSSVTSVEVPAVLTMAEKIALKKSGKSVPTMNIPAATPADNLPPPDAIQSLLVVPEDSQKLEGFNANEFVSLLPALRSALDTKAPGIASYLTKINENLNQYQELAHLLNEDQLALLTEGFFFLTDTDIAKAVTKKNSRAVMTIDLVDKMF